MTTNILPFVMFQHSLFYFVKYVEKTKLRRLLKQLQLLSTWWEGFEPRMQVDRTLKASTTLPGTLTAVSKQWLEFPSHNSHASDLATKKKFWLSKNFQFANVIFSSNFLRNAATGVFLPNSCLPIHRIAPFYVSKSFKIVCLESNTHIQWGSMLNSL
jgi:hypothetical protein